jgi:hypothetical protein
MRERSERETLQRMRELLEVPSPEELEAAVPDRVAAGMWSAVRPLVAGRRRNRHARTWLVPALAAASVALALLAGGLAVERATILGRQAALEDRVARQESRLATLETTARAERPSAIALVAAPDWARDLARRDTVTLGQVLELLARVPGQTTLLDASELAAIGAGRAGSFAGRGAWSELTTTLDLADGLQAGELLEALRELDFGDGTAISTARVIELYRAARRAARS